MPVDKHFHECNEIDCFTKKAIERRDCALALVLAMQRLN